MTSAHSEYIACLPMYDLEELQGANDALCQTLRDYLQQDGVDDLPLQLTRHSDLVSSWLSPNLFLGQTCGYPLTHELQNQVQLIATPVYSALGCDGAWHRSATVVARNSTINTLADLRGSRCAINSFDSNSGMNLLRYEIAPHAQNGAFFGQAVQSGSHRASLQYVATGQADVAAIDCVTLAHLALYETEHYAAIRILQWTVASPSLPFITALTTSPATIRALRAAWHKVLQDQSLADIRQQLFLHNIQTLTVSDYACITQYETCAAQHGYSTLA